MSKHNSSKTDTHQSGAQRNAGAGGSQESAKGQQERNRQSAADASAQVTHRNQSGGARGDSTRDSASSGRNAADKNEDHGKGNR